jgi:hypothetical protein
MRLLDEQYTQTPFYGIGRMTAWLRTQGHEVNHKRVARLMRLMGIEAIYPGPHLSRAGPSVSVSAEKCKRRAGESGVEHGHHLHTASAWLSLPGGDPGSV